MEFFLSFVSVCDVSWRCYDVPVVVFFFQFTFEVRNPGCCVSEVLSFNSVDYKLVPCFLFVDIVGGLINFLNGVCDSSLVTIKVRVLEHFSCVQQHVACLVL